MKTAAIRELRNDFPKHMKLVETEGEVLMTEKDKAKYRLSLYSPPIARKASPVNYWERLNSYQSAVMTERQARTLHEDNRGDR